jgi:predicted transcriptional regulator of viral defense system
MFTHSDANYGIFYAMRQPSSHALAQATTVFEEAGGVLRTSEALARGIEERTLYAMRDEGLVETLSRGVHHLSAMPLPAYPDIAAVFRRTPRAVLCLVSALDFHEIGTQIPRAVQIALPAGVKAPRIGYPRIERFTMSEVSIVAGVDSYDVGGTTVHVFSVAKTVADCFKFRRRIGTDVAVEALQEAVRGRRATPAEITRFAMIDRVANVVRPYLEALQ